MSAYLPGKSVLSSVRLMEARWRAGHREDLSHPLWDRRDPQTGRRGGSTEESAQGILVCTHTLGGGGAVGRALAPSCCMCTHHPCGHAPSSTDVQRKAGRRGRQRGGRGISIIPARSECHWWLKVPFPTPSPLLTLINTSLALIPPMFWFVFILYMLSC